MLEAAITKRTLLHEWCRRIPLIAWNAERTGHHAVAAAHALLAVVQYYAFGRAIHGADRAGRNAGWFQAVTAKLAHKSAFWAFNNG